MPQPPGARAEDLDRAASGGDDARAGLDLRVGENRPVQAHGLEDAQHLVVDHRGTGERVGLLLAVERQHAHAVV